MLFEYIHANAYLKCVNLFVSKYNEFIYIAFIGLSALSTTDLWSFPVFQKPVSKTTMQSKSFKA